MHRRTRSHLLAFGLALALALPLPALTAQPASAANINTCAAAAAANPNGWYKSRTEWCKIEPLSAGEQSNGRVIGTMNAVYLIAVTTSPTSRAVHVDLQVKNISSSGTLANASLSVRLPCSGCTPGAARGRTAPLSNWRTNSVTSFDFTGGLGDVVSGGPDRVAFHNFYPRFVLNGRITYDARGTSFRCDQASYIARGTAGCVFEQYLPTQTFSRGDVPQVAQHISDALTRPATTYPTWQGKTVPNTLHRLFYDKELRRKNSRTALATCKRYFPGYTEDVPKKDCDEYPFSATREGAAKGDNRYSARPVDRSQNRSAGGQLNAFWERNRVIDGDVFRVAVGR